MRASVANRACAAFSLLHVNDVAISITDTPSVEQRQIVVGGLVGYNDATASVAQFRELAVLSHDSGKLVGGLLGFTNWNWLFIKQLWVSEALRGSGLGRRLVTAAEGEAVRRGCAHAHCDTFGFQALPFYEKLGYHVFGRLEDYPPGHTRYYLEKRNLERN